VDLAKKSNNISELNSKIWNQWADEKGSIGKAYGYQLGIKNKYAEGEFDQVDRVLFDLKNNPASRRIITNIYNHSDLHAMNLYPCAYSLTLNVAGGKLNGILNQRSQDFLVANNWNVCQYAVLLHMFAQVSKLQIGEFIHVIADAHIYDRHVPVVEELITREPFPAPTLRINRDITDFYKFTVDDFALENYHAHEFKMKIEVAV
jgi:thymidylate synthase